MAEPKPFASLTSGLLARKGAAKPAMRRQNPVSMHSGHGHDDLGWNDMGYDVDPQQSVDDVADVQAFKPLRNAIPGHVDNHAAMAPEVIDPGAAKSVPDVVRQRDDLASRLAEALPAEPVSVEAAASDEPAREAPVAATPTPARARPKAKEAKGRRAAFTLRVDAERHLMLRLACAVRGESAQQLVTRALDQFLADQPQLDDLARRASDHARMTARPGKSA